MANLEMEELRLIAEVRKALTEKNMMQKQLAEAVELSTGAMSMALNGMKRLPCGTWRKICDVLQLDYDAIVSSVVPGCAEAVEAGKPDVYEGVLVKAEPEELYRIFCFCEERLADNLERGTKMQPEELYKLMTAMYALRDATLALQPGETY